MHCWFCESPLRSGGPGSIYCPYADCPACKDLAPAYALLDAPEPGRWRRLRLAGRLGSALRTAGFSSSANRFP